MKNFHPMKLSALLLGILVAFLCNIGALTATPSLDTAPTVGSIDLELDLFVSNSDLVIYTDRTYILTARNNSDQPATNVKVHFPVPDGLVYTDQNLTHGKYSTWDGIWHIDYVGPGQAVGLQLTLFSLVENTSLTSYAQITQADQQDCDSTPNNGSCCTPVEDDEVAVTIGEPLIPTLNITCVDNFSVQVASGVSSASVTIPEPSVMASNCPSFTLTYGLEGGGLSGNNTFNLPLGTTTIRVVALGSGNCTDQCTVDVTVEEEASSLSLACANDFTITAAQGATTANVTVPEAVVTAVNCPSFSVSYGLQGGGLSSNRNFDLPIGTNTIRAIVFSSNNDCSDECTFNVTVVEEGNGTTVGYTANDQVTPYGGFFRPGINTGYNPPWSDEQLADIAAGNPALGIPGVGAKAIRPGLYDQITTIFGYDIRVDTYDYYESLGMDDLTMIVGFPVDWHRDLTDYCGDGVYSAMFAHLYKPIWDNGENGTPYNDENYYAAYLYEVVTRYEDHVKFWEIWNEPGFDLTGNLGWRPPGDPIGNWWDRDPDPCESILRAPVEHYIRTLRISWEIIKSIAPDDYVVVAGVGFESFLDAVLRNTDNPDGGTVTAEYPNYGGAYFDVMGFHTYPDIDGSIRNFIPETGGFEFFRHSDAAANGVARRQTLWQEVLTKHGYDGNTFPKKEWILTEFNVPRVPFRDIAMTGGEELQINYIIKAVVVGMRNKVHQMHAYTLGDKKPVDQASEEFDLLGMYDYLGTTDIYNQQMHSQGIAYKTTSDFLYRTRHDAERTAQMNLPDNMDGGAFRKENGEYVYLIWAKTTIDQSEFASATYSFPTSMGIGQLYRHDWNHSQTKQSSPMNSTNIQLNARPIFLTTSPVNIDNDTPVEARAQEPNRLSFEGVYPSPATDELNVNVSSLATTETRIEIMDALGRVHLQQSVQLTMIPVVAIQLSYAHRRRKTISCTRKF